MKSSLTFLAALVIVCACICYCAREYCRAWVTVAAIECGKINPIKKTTKP